jgi:hypothetical protein
MHGTVPEALDAVCSASVHGHTSSRPAGLVGTPAASNASITRIRSSRRLSGLFPSSQRHASIRDRVRRPREGSGPGCRRAWHGYTPSRTGRPRVRQRSPSTREPGLSSSAIGPWTAVNVADLPPELWRVLGMDDARSFTVATGLVQGAQVNPDRRGATLSLPRGGGDCGPCTYPVLFIQVLLAAMVSSSSANDRRQDHNGQLIIP